MGIKKHKIVPVAKQTEWLGLDRISEVVHGMGCVWREQQKDDIGIDGEIELCKTRFDADGLFGTSKFIKVQVKSGRSYVKRDSEATFECPVNYNDLCYWRQSNVPVIFIVFHIDDDQLYWVDVKNYIENNPTVLSKPHHFLFNKDNQRFDHTAYPALCKICNEAVPRVSGQLQETLYSNLLRVTELPQNVFLSSVIPDKQALFHHRLPCCVPPYLYREGSVLTLTHPRKTENALKPMVDSTEQFTLDEWADATDSSEQDLKRLLNQLLHLHLVERGLELHDQSGRYFFALPRSGSPPIKETWLSPKSKRTHERTVIGYHEYGSNKFFHHLALKVRFHAFDDVWYLALEPSHYYSLDGFHKVWRGEAAKSYRIRQRSREYNQHLLNHILFWTYYVSMGDSPFSLETEGYDILSIAGEVANLITPFGIPS